MLPRLFERVLVPPAVIEEMQHSRAPVAVLRWAHALPAWIEVCPPKSTLTLSLGLGETEAITLALERPGVNLLIDDRKGASAAQSLGIGTLGTLALLELASHAGLVEFEVTSRKLRAAGFYCADAIFAEMLKRVRKGDADLDLS